MIALTAATLFTPSERIDHPLLLLEDERVVEVTSLAAHEAPRGARLIDFRDDILAPAFIDIHIHGGAGHDVMEASPTALPTIAQSLARHGVSSYFPTTVTAPVETILAALDRLASAIEASRRPEPDDVPHARPLGIHLEGPFLSHARRGVHPPENLLKPSLGTFKRFWEAACGDIRLITIAPELEGAQEIIAEAVKLGICVSLGHSDANFAVSQAAVSAGARHATHTFNAMRPLGHRDPGILGEVLTDARLSADIIADGVHLDSAIVKLFVQAKGLDSSVLITDAISATGMPDGQYRLGSLEVEVKNGQCLSNGRLAGSVLTMDRAVRNLMQFADLNLQQALRAATLNPARVVREERRGRLAAGSNADIVVLTPGGDLRKTIVCGRNI
jgi:N-acetylglucosamine-6-phosphate deacetylase